MIEPRSGNILDDHATALVNTVNTFGVMGKGIALQFRQAFPENYEVYRRACEKGEVTPGHMLVVPTNRLQNPKYIINFPTKRHWKGKSRIEDIKVGLVDLVAVLKRERIESIAIPPLGCGNGGLDWQDVRPLIVDALGSLPTVVVHLYEPHGAPAVEAMRIATKKPHLTSNGAALLSVMRDYGIPGYQLTLLEIQKLAYFLQMAGQPWKLNFEKNKYGPYAEELNHVLQRMEGHYIRGYGDRSREASVRVLAEGSETADQILMDEVSTVERVARVAELIEGFETPHGMELLASVHWVTQESAIAKTDWQESFALIQSWNERKQKVFPASQVRVAFGQLKHQGWI
ncbi:MAG: macro domain-containing protein [Bryobacteraceae bacterium]